MLQGIKYYGVIEPIAVEIHEPSLLMSTAPITAEKMNVYAVNITVANCSYINLHLTN